MFSQTRSYGSPVAPSNVDLKAKQNQHILVGSPAWFRREDLTGDGTTEVPVPTEVPDPSPTKSAASDVGSVEDEPHRITKRLAKVIQTAGTNVIEVSEIGKLKCKLEMEHICEGVHDCETEEALEAAIEEFGGAVAMIRQLKAGVVQKLKRAADHVKNAKNEEA